MRIGRDGVRVLALLAAALVAGCATGGRQAMSGAQPASPFYGVPASMMNPDGTMSNGLTPINPDDQS
jgi:hypothetical protein